jgi:RNA polymerase sigma-70 factor (ECF subfamily)
MSRDPADDESLMLRYRDGDAGAFEVLYRRHRAGLYRFCLRMCGSPARAEEVFQDAWLNLIQARSRYRVEARFRTFLYQIARNRMLDVLRHDGRPAISLDSEEGAPVAAALEAPDAERPDVLLQRSQVLRGVADALDRLPAVQREALLLHEEGELTLEEIAALTGVGRETVKSRVRYALARLRAELAAEPVEGSAG